MHVEVEREGREAFLCLLKKSLRLSVSSLEAVDSREAFNKGERQG